MLYTPSAHYVPRKPTGAKLALKPIYFGAYVFACRSRAKHGTSRSSIWRWIVNSADVTWCACGSQIFSRLAA